MQRIIIVGSPGSGKSTLAKKLARAWGLPVVHLDQLFWKPGWVEASREEFDEKLRQELKKEQWIMDGNFGRTMAERLAYADGVIFLDYPPRLCAWRVMKRVIRNYGKTRSDMGADCPERFDAAFLWFVLCFRRKNRAKIYRRLADAPEKTQIIIKNRREYRAFCRAQGID